MRMTVPEHLRPEQQRLVQLVRETPRKNQRPGWAQPSQDVMVLPLVGHDGPQPDIGEDCAAAQTAMLEADSRGGIVAQLDHFLEDGQWWLAARIVNAQPAARNSR